MNRGIFSFGERTAVITGGGGNIGSAIALRFAQAGLRVALVGSRKERLLPVTERLQAEGLVASSWGCDLTATNAIEPLLGDIAVAHGAIDILVNCAGVLDMSAIEDTSIEGWDHVLDVNLKAAFFMTQKAIPYLQRGSAPRIINISSNAGRMGGFANGMSYTASKGGLIALTYGLARQLAPSGITVNCVAPGTIESDMSRARDDATMQQLLQRFPIGRLGTADEVAYAACYFASIQSSFTTGAVLDVNGGLFMG